MELEVLASATDDSVAVRAIHPGNEREGRVFVELVLDRKDAEHLWGELGNVLRAPREPWSRSS